MNWMSSDSTLRYSAADMRSCCVGRRRAPVSTVRAVTALSAGSARNWFGSEQGAVASAQVSSAGAGTRMPWVREANQVSAERGFLALLGKRRRRAVERGAQGELVDRFAELLAHHQLQGRAGRALFQSAAVVEARRVARACRQRRVEPVVDVAGDGILIQRAQICARR